MPLFDESPPESGDASRFLSRNFSRRAFLQRTAFGAFGAGALVAGVQGFFQAQEYLDQQATWREASRPNDEFFARHAAALDRLHLGASFTTQHWSGRDRSQVEAMRALRFVTQELGVKQMRLGIRWSSTEREDGSLTLDSIRPALDHCLRAGVDVCLNVGPVRTFRYPEEYVPRHVLAALRGSQPVESVIRPDSPLAAPAVDYLDRLLDRLQTEYGRGLPGVSMLQIENEPFYPLGAHKWTASPAYLAALAQRVDAAVPGKELLVTSAGRLNLREIVRTFTSLIQADDSWRGRLVSGFDFYYRTPLRDSKPVVRNFDPITYSRPFALGLEDNLRQSRSLDYRIEVSEAQAEPYDYLHSPGNSARDFRYVLLRCLDKVLDPAAPALVRIWGVEELAKKALRDRLTPEHHQIIEVFQAVNNRAPQDAG